MNLKNVPHNYKIIKRYWFVKNEHFKYVNEYLGANYNNAIIGMFEQMGDLYISYSEEKFGDVVNFDWSYMPYPNYHPNFASDEQLPSRVYYERNGYEYMGDVGNVIRKMKLEKING